MVATISSDLLAAAVAAADNAMMVTDGRADPPGPTIVYVSPAFCRLTGYAADELIGQSPRILKSGEHDAAFYQELWRQLLANDHWAGEIWNRHRDGLSHPLWDSISVVRDSAGAIESFVAVFHDISERKQLESMLRHETMHDPLTGAYSHGQIERFVAQEIERAGRYDAPFAVVMLDIDDFQAIADTHGHQVGEEILRQVTRHLQDRLRRPDVVGRWGGAALAMLLPETTGPGAAELAERLRQEVHELDLQEAAAVTVSLGVTASLGDEPLETVIDRLEAALSEAQSEGGDRVVTQ